jgi:hypothetical protein
LSNITFTGSQRTNKGLAPLPRMTRAGFTFATSWRCLPAIGIAKAAEANNITHAWAFVYAGLVVDKGIETPSRKVFLFLLFGLF